MMEELRGVMCTTTMHPTTGTTNKFQDINGVMNNITQTNDKERNNTAFNEAETLPDLVLDNNMTLNEANTMEDEDDAADALLQLSRSDTIPDDTGDNELPIGTLPVDAAPVPITLGKQDVLTAIENFKQSNGITTDKTNDQNTPDFPKSDNNENFDEGVDKKNPDKSPEHPSASEVSPPASPVKGSLVIIKYGIWQKQIINACTNAQGAANEKTVLRS